MFEIGVVEVSIFSLPSLLLPSKSYVIYFIAISWSYFE